MKLVCGYSAVQKLAVNAEVQEKYPQYHLYLYGEGFVSFSHCQFMCLRVTCKISVSDHTWAVVDDKSHCSMQPWAQSAMKKSTQPSNCHPSDAKINIRFRTK